MKKIIALMLALALTVPFAACNETEVAPEEKIDIAQDETVKVMTHEEFITAEIDSPVVVETYVQAKQAWWENKGTFYTQAEDGAYFIYELPCSEDEYNKLVPGTKIRVSGSKAEWSGEVEIVDATYEILEGNFVAEPFDATALLGTDELIKHQNELASFKGLTVKSVKYKNDAPGDDIYLTLSLDDKDYNFCVEVYLTGTESEVYKTVGTLNEGDIVDVEGFLYWYVNVNPHITAITVAK